MWVQTWKDTNKQRDPQPSMLTKLLLIKAEAFIKGFHRNTTHSYLGEHSVLKPTPRRGDNWFDHKGSMTGKTLGPDRLSNGRGDLEHVEPLEASARGALAQRTSMKVKGACHDGELLKDPFTVRGRGSLPCLGSR